MDKELNLTKPENSNDTIQDSVSVDAPLNDEQAAVVTPSENDEERPVKTKIKRNRKPIEQNSIEAETPSEVDSESEIDINYEGCTKGELLDHISQVVLNNDINSIKRKVALIKVAFYRNIKEEQQKHFNDFIAKGGIKESYVQPVDPIEEKFNEQFSIYKKLKHKFDEENEKQKEQNLIEKQKIIEQLKTLIDSEEKLKNTYDSFKGLQEQWKQIGMVPKAAINDLWQQYHFLVERFFDKVKINNELKNLDLKKNLELKIKICEEAESLLLEPSVTNAFKKLQKCHEDWREVGPVLSEKKDEIWGRFRTITEKINQIRLEYFKNLEAEQEKNYTIKIGLCEKVEQFSEINPGSYHKWNELTQELFKIQDEWKNTGSTPKKVNDEIWMRFKAAISKFYGLKKEYFNSLKDEQVNNYNLKLNICVNAEALIKTTTWKRSTEEIIALQNEWKKIGPVPQKYSDKIWKRFRSACDAFFAAKADFFKNISSKEDENLKLKLDLISKLKTFQFSENKNENLQTIKEFQREWMNIGFVPVKEKDRLQNEFHKAIDEQLDNLKIGTVEKKTISYKNKMESVMSNSSNSSSIVYKEKTSLTNQLTTLKNEIKLLENNLGFFAKSKNADVLKKGFEEKIEHAKEQIKIIEEKLKFLRNS